MINRALVLFFASFLITCGSLSAVQAKPSAPVKIDYTVPKTVQAGDDVITIIRFTSKADLQYLTVSTSPYSGLELLSLGESITFINLKAGDIREISVSIRLLEELGYLSVFATTTNLLGSTRSRNIAIGYGSSNAIELKKKQSKGVESDSQGNRLILMQGEAR